MRINSMLYSTSIKLSCNVNLFVIYKYNINGFYYIRVRVLSIIGMLVLSLSNFVGCISVWACDPYTMVVLSLQCVLFFLSRGFYFLPMSSGVKYCSLGAISHKKPLEGLVLFLSNPRYTVSTCEHIFFLLSPFTLGGLKITLLVPEFNIQSQVILFIWKIW